MKLSLGPVSFAAAIACAAALACSTMVACSSRATSGTSTPDGGAGLGGDGGATTDPSGSDGGAGDAAADAAADGGGSVVGSCVVRRATDGSGCAEDCDARLTLPGGGKWCTMQCEAPSDCATPAGDLTCPPEVVACVPRCTNDATCKALGFKRCDLDAGGCDTL